MMPFYKNPTFSICKNPTKSRKMALYQFDMSVQGIGPQMTPYPEISLAKYPREREGQRP
jgi:hypothetical protein